MGLTRETRMSDKSSKPELVEKAISVFASEDDKKKDSSSSSSSDNNEKKDKKDEREHPSSKRMQATSRSAVIGQDLRSLAMWCLRFILVVAAGYILYKLCHFIW